MCYVCYKKIKFKTFYINLLLFLTDFLFLFLFNNSFNILSTENIPDN